MKCPICEDVRMREVIKDGVTIDVCPDCKGVWLDRGELDKLMQGVNAMRQELDEYENGQVAGLDPSAAQAPPPAAPLPPIQQQGAPSAQTYPPQAPPAPGYGQPYQQQPGAYGTPQQPIYGNPQHGQGQYGSMPPQGGYGSSHKYDKYGSKYGYDKYGRPYKKRKTVLDVFGDLFD